MVMTVTMVTMSDIRLFKKDDNYTYVPMFLGYQKGRSWGNEFD